MTIKAASYFPVRTNNYSTTKSAEIRMEFGYAGYGIYFALLQILASTPTRTLELNKLRATAYNMHCDEKELSTIVHNYFDVEGDIFYSQELNESLEWFDEKYNKQSAGGKKTQSQLTPEQRSEKGRMASAARWGKESKTDSVANSCQAVSTTMPSNLETNANNKTEKNITEERKEEKVNQEKEPISKGIQNTSYDIQGIQEELRNYTSNYFTSSNTDYISNTYNEFRKEVPTSINLKKFEPLIYLHFYGLFLSDNNTSSNGVSNTPKNEVINNYISNNQYKVSPNDIKSLVNSVNTKPEIRKIYKDIVENSQHQLPKPSVITSTFGKTFTQEQVGDYADMPF